ncbi:MAG TPA: MgtC/SapB family protein [Gemmatimonadales bacterium]|nr:MgtC/SapB family protein [Gemmatimonadales bacterium]
MLESVAPPDTLVEAIGRLLVATLAGGIIGTERELHAKPAGVRTHALVALGAALVLLAGLLLGPGKELHPDAVSRVIQGLMAGIGFLGAGSILQRSQQSLIHGLTTAASLWIVAVIGIGAGLGLWRLTLAATCIVLLVLLAERPLTRLLGTETRTDSQRQTEAQ